MHKLVTTALIALLLIASPLMMFGTSDSNIFSKAMAIEEDGSETDIKSFIKSNDESEGNDESSDEGNDESSDEGNDESSDEGNDESSDEGNDESSDAIQQNQNNDEPQPVVDTSQPIQQSQNNEPQQQQQQQQQTTKQSQQGNKQLSIISQEEMQQQQYENFKKLYESIKQKHKEIEILK